MKTLFTLCTALLLMLAGSQAHAQDFVYEPKNPSFGGGNSFNYQWLLSSATSQNTIEEPARDTGTGVNANDPLNGFAENLNRQILSQLTSRFITSQFGSGPVREGSYTVGTYQIEVTPGANGVVIQITDSSTGNQTTVTIPNIP
ncbi:curli production assembly/transport component CsgF [Hymenobacter yonginensis]|uniref:Curli production assembly/transport component CsgF n=1 Tax=Hymenobacter yonginensis TaxID=748197 RepID=A0ABY7PGU5_9BACT|nr:curli production assembly/transport component CsgF [Hymenobacter yonginensis]WBO82775.1 curli assembly protein CsgF [Hymenobacter yonginensis]